MAWRKSSYSHTHGTSDCVELADLSYGIGVRDSKNPAVPPLVVSREQLTALVVRIRTGDFDG